MSPIINPDTSDMEDLTPIEPNTYSAGITKVEPEKSAKGNAMIVVSFAVNTGGEKPRTRKSYVVTQGAGSFNFDQLLRCCGFADLADQYKDPAVENPPFDTDNFIGQSVQVVIDHQEYKGQIRDSIMSFLPA